MTLEMGGGGKGLQLKRVAVKMDEGKLMLVEMDDGNG